MQDTLGLFQEIAEQLLEAEKKQAVVPPIPPTQVAHKLALNLEHEAISKAAFKALLTQLVLHTPRTATKLFFNQLFGGRNPYATLGDLLAVLLNNSMYTYKVAGPQVGVEKEIIKQVVALINYPTTADGTFTSGGSMSNLIALLMARDKADAQATQQGVSKPLVAYTSEDSHYSIEKNAAFIGIGRNAVRKIPTDSHGRMQINALEKAIQNDIKKGLIPFFINATAGTTVLGAFDAIEDIQLIAKKHLCWLHVDGAYCGSVIFSAKHRHLVKGLAHADSFNFNAHKMLGTPLTCSIIVTRDKAHLRDTLSQEAAYLYQTDTDEFNLGKTSLQCGRRNDALKFWTLWKAIGTQGLEKAVNTQFTLAQYAYNYVINHPDYTVYSFENSVSVCFNYKNIPAQKLCTALYNAGALMVGFGSFKNNTFIRLVTINYQNTNKEIELFFKTLETFVAKHPEMLSQ